jgi:hypothetical protein
MIQWTLFFEEKKELSESILDISQNTPKLIFLKKKFIKKTHFRKFFKRI